MCFTIVFYLCLQQKLNFILFMMAAWCPYSRELLLDSFDRHFQLTVPRRIRYRYVLVWLTFSLNFSICEMKYALCSDVINHSICQILQLQVLFCILICELPILMISHYNVAHWFSMPFKHHT